ncbi:mitochondrial sodium/calcium exchanger protein-like isoform X2 [Ptychodera flava]|uniref:mitochondrial sodium/calcium exchanger protein-like isoform X2 n=1 Tax=Ptychodera flava TaxID=63121 RepID=UPI003969D32B
MDTCHGFHKVNQSQQCWYIKNTSDCKIDDGFINYLEVVYCHFDHKLIPLAMVLMFIWLICLFIALGNTAEDFFCPALTVISHTLKLSQNVAGVTFLAFGNGAPDIFSAIAAITNAKNGDAGLAVGALFGAGVFVTTIVAGSIALTRPFKAAERPFLRDCIFYLAAAFWTFTILWDGKITLAQAIGFIGLYAFYVIVVIVGRKIYQYQKKKRQAAESNGADAKGEYNSNNVRTEPFDSSEIDPETCKYYGAVNSKHDVRPSQAIKGVLDVTEQVTVAPLFGNQVANSPAFLPQTSREEIASIGSDEFSPLLGRVDSRPPPSQLKALLHGINPIDTENWKQKPFYAKFYEIFKSPFQFAFQITIPVVDYDEENHNWNRLLNTLHVITGPVFCIFVTKVAFKPISGGFLAWHLVLCICVVLALVVFFTSKHEHYPIYHWAFAYIGFVVAVLWIYSIANEIVNILQMFGLQFNISDAILGLTLLAWGNSIGDLIADTTMAKQGFPNMGMSACFGGPMFNMLLGIGISCTIATIKHGGSFKLNYNPIQTVLASGLAISLLSSLFIMLITKFHVTRPYGIYLIVLYIIFLTVALLVETDVINL